MPRKNRKNKSRGSTTQPMTNHSTSKPEEPSVHSNESSSKYSVDHPKRRVIFSYEHVLLQKLLWNHQPNEELFIKIQIVEKETYTEARTFLEFEHNCVSITSVTECIREGWDTFLFSGEPFQQGEDARWKIVFPQNAGGSTCTAFYKTLRNRGLRIINRNNSNDENERAVRRENVPYQPREETTYSNAGLQNNMLSNLIVQGARYISEGVIEKAEAVSHIMDTEPPSLINDRRATVNPVAVDPGLRTGLKVARFVSGEVASVAENAANAARTEDVATRSTFASVVHEVGTRILSHSYNYAPEEAHQTVNNGLQIAGGTSEGWDILRNGLFNAAQILGNSFTNNVVKVVENNFGEEVAEATDDALRIVGHITAARFNANRHN